MRLFAQAGIASLTNLWACWVTIFPKLMTKKMVMNKRHEKRKKFRQLLSTIGCSTLTQQCTYQKKTQELEIVPGLHFFLFAFCLFFLFFYFTLRLFFVFVYLLLGRKVSRAPVDGNFEVDWVDDQSMACAYEKLVKVPKPGSIFTGEDGKKYKIMQYAPGEVQLQIIAPGACEPEPEPKPQRVTRSRNKKTTAAKTTAAKTKTITKTKKPCWKKRRAKRSKPADESNNGDESNTTKPVHDAIKPADDANNAETVNDKPAEEPADELESTQPYVEGEDNPRLQLTQVENLAAEPADESSDNNPVQEPANKSNKPAEEPAEEPAAGVDLDETNPLVIAARGLHAKAEELCKRSKEDVHPVRDIACLLVCFLHAYLCDHHMMYTCVFFACVLACPSHDVYLCVFCVRTCMPIT